MSSHSNMFVVGDNIDKQIKYEFDVVTNVNYGVLRWRVGYMDLQS